LVRVHIVSTESCRLPRTGACLTLRKDATIKCLRIANNPWAAKAFSGAYPNRTQIVWQQQAGHLNVFADCSVLTLHANGYISTFERGKKFFEMPVAFAHSIKIINMP
jgi:hypothetical protein